MVQVAHSDAQRTQAELARLRVTVGELQERCDALARDNKQLSGQFHFIACCERTAYCTFIFLKR